MPFTYYERLTRAQKVIYQKSDEVTAVRLPEATTLRPLVDDLAAALADDDRLKTQTAAQQLLAGLVFHLDAPAVRVEVLAARPARSWGELHGLYTPANRSRPAHITLWMRTARQKRVVAFRTFLRTLLHELGHHLDYTFLGLADSFHTEGFYKRESSLFHQLMG
jgi:hypothetical protein